MGPDFSLVAKIVITKKRGFHGLHFTACSKPRLESPQARILLSAISNGFVCVRGISCLSS
jgi:hypothetical protein